MQLSETSEYMLESLHVELAATRSVNISFQNATVLNSVVAISISSTTNATVINAKWIIQAIQASLS